MSHGAAPYRRPRASLADNLQRSDEAGFDGISVHWYDPATVAGINAALGDTRMRSVEGMRFPRTVDDLTPALETCARYPVHHLSLQRDVCVRKLGEAVRPFEGWMRLAGEVDVPVDIETHCDRLTTDLFFTLDLLDEIPTLPLLADLSHVRVGRDFSAIDADPSFASLDRRYRTRDRVVT